MAERGYEHREPERAENGPEDDGHDAAKQLRRAVEQERHRLEARRYFDAAPFYRVRFEENGTVTLCAKRYDYWPNRPPAAATRWRTVSNHPDLEQAERRIRRITSPPVYYDERGCLVRARAAD